jgi:hypothetical protein
MVVVMIMVVVVTTTIIIIIIIIINVKKAHFCILPLSNVMKNGIQSSPSGLLLRDPFSCTPRILM